ncbi:MAG: outer-membrane lipoprotein carrier protein LolA [Elusimicrobia bacterium]|nr:outer-membrane lipoprotein carrier protein LolA [Elusimicrobiota bacterium]
MGNLAVAALLVLTTSCFAKEAKKTAKAAAKIDVSSAAAGTELTAYAPSTAPITIQLIALRFAETDAKINTLKASFRQFVHMDGSDVTQTVEGDVLFKKPDLLRLTHRIPEPQTVVSDGTWLWVYRNSTNQVIQSRLDAWRKSEPMAQGLLDFGKSADLLTRYETEITTVTAPGADGHRSFTLTLKPKAADRKGPDSDFVLTLKADTKDFFPADATLRVGRVMIRSLFEGVRLNPAIPEETFKFTPPADADLFKSPEPK